MTVQELIEAAKNSTMTEERLQILRDVVAEAEKRFEEDERRCKPTPEDLNRTYTI